MAEAPTNLLFSFIALSHLEVVTDNARSHAPFQNPYIITAPSSSDDSSCVSSELGQVEDIDDRSPLSISPARGLTRWGSKEDLISNMGPKPPRRSSTADSPADSPISWCHEPPPARLMLPPAPALICSLGTINDRTMSSSNIPIDSANDYDLNDANVCMDTNAIGKISPILPRRPVECLENFNAPQLADTTLCRVADHTSKESSQSSAPFTRSPEKSLWKPVVRQPSRALRLEDLANMAASAAVARTEAKNSDSGQVK